MSPHPDDPLDDDVSSPSRVVLVLDTALANLVSVTLRHGLYEIRESRTEDAFRALVDGWRPHLAIVDIDRFSPLLDRLDASIEHGRMSILALTRQRDTKLKLQAFEKGVDDIIEVPFTLDEIVARPYALIRRSRGFRPPLVPRISLGGHLEVDLLEQRVMLDGERSLVLTPIQQALLYILASNAGEILTREVILSAMWGEAFQIESNVVDRHIRELRVKLGDDWRTPKYIETVPGRGYRFRRSTDA